MPQFASEEAESLIFKRSERKWRETKLPIPATCFLILGTAALSLLTGTFVISILSYAYRESKFTQETATSHFHNDGYPKQLYHNQYVIKYDLVGAYIDCPLQSPTAAREAGCSFDLLINGYIPDPCFDAEMHEDFTAGVELGYFVDKEATEMVSTAELLKGDFDMYPMAWLSTISHWRHCLYLINGTHRAYSRMPTVFLDAYLDQPHIQHCFGVVAGPKPPLPPVQMEHPMIAVFVAEHRCYLRDLSPFPPQDPGAVNIAITHPSVISKLERLGKNVTEDD
jgi:hypothetical protein